MGSQSGAEEDVNMQQRLDQVADISEDEFAEYFLQHIKDIFQLKKGSIIDLLENRDKPAINTIRDTLLLRIGELHEVYRSKTPIKRQNMNKAYEDIYILGYNWLNPGHVTTDLSTVYREETKILPSQLDSEATLPAPAAEVVDSSGAQQTNGDSIGDSPDYSDDSEENINVDNSYLETQASNILQDNNQLEEKISNISQYISRMQQYIRDNFIAVKNKQDQQQLNINELQQENIKLNKTSWPFGPG